MAVDGLDQLNVDLPTRCPPNGWVFDEESRCTTSPQWHPRIQKFSKSDARVSLLTVGLVTQLFAATVTGLTPRPEEQSGSEGI